MTSTLGLITVGLCLMGVLLFLVRGLRPAGEAATRWTALAAYRTSNQQSAFVPGPLAAVTLASLPEVGGGPARPAAAWGLLFGLLTLLGGARAARHVGTGVGVGALFAAARSFAAATTCSQVPPAARVAVPALLPIAAAVSPVVASVRIGLHLLTPLAIFGGGRVLGFLASPLGVSLVALSPIAWVVMPAAVLFGFAAWVAPGAVVAVSVTAVAVSTFAARALVGTPCDAEARPGDLVALVASAVVYGLVADAGRTARRVLGG